jgi:hypothetical protein
MQSGTNPAMHALVPADLLTWFRRIRWVSQPDVGAGFFLQSDTAIGHLRATGCGIRPVCDDDVVVIGSDGIGALVANVCTLWGVYPAEVGCE